MKQKDVLNIIPDHFTGTDIEAEASTTFNSEGESRQFFNQAKTRLLSVNKWHDVAGMISASFQLIDKAGKEVNRGAEKGDYLRVDIPGPGSKAGEGYDWVEVEELKEIDEGNMQSVGFRVRPVSNPFNQDDSIAHFYDQASTSNFIVTRVGETITASILDRNIKPNQETSSVIDKIRDTAIGMSAMASFSKIQWQSLADGLVKKD